MSIQDLLSVVLVLGFLIITACVVYVTFYLVQALKAITNLSNSWEDVTENIKEKIQMKALAALPALFVALVTKIFRKRR